MAFSACFGGIIFSILWVLGELVVVVLGTGAASVSLPAGKKELLLLGDPWQGAGQDPCQSTWDVVFVDSRDGASSIPPLSPLLSQPQLGGSSGWSLAHVGSAKGREGRG